jgi:hypothetical protein
LTVSARGTCRLSERGIRSDREWTRIYFNRVSAFVMRLIEAMEMLDAQCVVTDVEIVAFDRGREYSVGVFELSHGTTQVG